MRMMNPVIAFCKRSLALPFICAALPVSAGANMEIRESSENVQVDTGAMEFAINLRRGIITELSVQGKCLIADNTSPILFATLMESSEYDGMRDFARRRFLKAENVFEGLTVTSKSGSFAASGRGTLVFPGDDSIGYALEIKAFPGETRLAIAVALEKRGQFHNRFIREVGLIQPLSLEKRKRVVQAGDQGLRWDTRFSYQFHMHVSVFNHAEQNWWRHFFVDQDTGHSYRIWRSESRDTGGLHAFAGRRAAGWMTLYDPEGGALFAYRDITGRAPKLLYADAAKGGKGIIYLYGPTQSAFSPEDPRLSSAVFGKTHEIDWIFFEGTEADAMPDSLLAKAWGQETLPSDAPTKFMPVADEIAWNAPASRGNNVPIVMGGIPVPKGAVTAPDQVRLFVKGRESPLQASPLAFWPDGSIKWLLLIFPLDGDGGFDFSKGKGEGTRCDFRVTLRQGGDVNCTLNFGKDVQAGIAREQKPMALQKDPDRVEIDTGPLRLAFCTGERWLENASLEGREMLAENGAPQASVDFIRSANYPVVTTHPDGKPDPGPVKIEKVEIEENGPLRAVLRLEGKAICAEPAHVIMRAEAYRGRSYIRLFHTVEFTQNDPRAAFVRRVGLRLPLALDAGNLQATAVGAKGAISLAPSSKFGLRQTSHVSYEAWRAADKGPYREIVESGHASRGWMDVSDHNFGLAVVQKNMWQEAPKELVFNRAESSFEIGLWPESSPLMDVRRYSNYPHQGQGESASTPEEPGKSAWIESHYKNGPFVGVSRTHESLLYFHAPKTSPGEIDAVASDFQSQPLVYAGWPWYASAGVTYPQPDPADEKFTQLNANLDRAADWWMFHQKCWGWYGFWDYGDVRHRFRSGYGRVFQPDTLAKLLALPPGQMAKESPDKLPQVQDYFTQGDWAFDNGRWGWGNTEGLVNHFMSQQYLRTGKRSLFFFMEANARHARDVDARHAGQYFGKGTRHGVQHWSDGNHEERQTVFSEQRFHYLLTGDQRTREWNKVLADNYYLKGACDRHADHSGRTYGLLFRWEITGDRELGETLRRYMEAFARPDGIDISTAVKFPGPERIGPPRELNNASMFFHNFGAMHALLEYYYLTENQVLKEGLIKMADAAIAACARDKKHKLSCRAAVAFAALHAPDRAPYLAALKKSMSTPTLFRQVPVNPAHWTGPSAYFSGNVSGGLFFLNDASYLAGALDSEPKVSMPDDVPKAGQYESKPEPEPRGARGSWQTEYDSTAFEKYIYDPLYENTLDLKWPD